MAKQTDAMSSEAFKEAVIRAKAVAAATGASVVSVELLLAGFDLLLGDPGATDVSDIADKAEAIRFVVAGTRPQGPLDLAAAATVRMPVTDELRRILATSGESLVDTIDALLDSSSPNERAGAELFDAVLSRAAAAAKQLDIDRVGPELFAVAAYHAYLAGDFLAYPAVSVHMATNKDDLVALARDKGWDPAAFAAKGPDVLPLESGFEKELGRVVGGRLLGGINLGATVGAKLRQLRATAIHEAGHAVVSFVLMPQVPIAELSIIPTGDSEGRLGLDGTAPYFALPASRRHFLEDTCVCLAGNIAQAIEFGQDGMDQGAYSDLQRATRNAWHSIAVYGLDDEFGPVCLAAFDGAPIEGLDKSGGWLRNRAEERLQQVLKTAAARTRGLLEENWHHVQAVSAALLEHRRLGAEALLALLVDKGLADWPGVRHVRSRPAQREVRFAIAAGVVASKEGPVQHQAGDALMTGAAGESWPIARARFEQDYRPIPPLQMGQDGTYAKPPRSALALRLNESRNVVLSGARGVLSGKAGDWIVDYGSGDLAIVSSERFDEYYETVI